MTPSQQLISMHDQLQEDAAYHFALQALVEMVEIYGVEQVRFDLQKLQIRSKVIPDNIRLGLHFEEVSK